MKVNAKLITVALALAGTGLGCSAGLDRFEARRSTVAPQSSQSVGVLARGAREEDIAQLLAAHSNARFRVLSSKDQFYEIFGISVREVQGYLPAARVSKNEFFPTREPASDSRIKLLAATEKDGLEKCKEGDKQPEAVLSVTAPQKEFAEKLLQKNTVIELDASKSVNKNHPGKPLKVAWIVISPRGSLQGEQVFPGEKLRLKVEALGAYGIALVVQDEKLVCNLDLIEFAVTANADYAGPGDGKGVETNLSRMKHLVDLHAREAWTLSQGEGIKIAVIDSGVHFNHPALRQNILVNEREIKNGVDDDGNGYVDDIVGYDFNYSDSSPFDDVGHGSHVAGLAASSVMGMARKAKILSVKALGAFGSDAGTVAAAIRYAVDRDVRIINMSFGSYMGPNPELVAAMDYAESKGVLVVTAAGNGHPFTGIGLSTDEMPHFPSTLPNPNILNVGARGLNGELAVYSNFGANSVDVAAPGGEESDPLVSCFLDSPSGVEFEGMNGTSMAAPLVAGIAAQFWALHPTYSATQVKQAVMKSGPEAPGLKGFVNSGRWADALATLKSGD